MTDEQMRDLAKECGLDWQRGYMPLFDDDPTNRYAILIEAVEAAVCTRQAERIKELEAYNATRTDELTGATRRVVELETQLATEKDRADYAWKNTHTIEAERQADRLRMESAEVGFRAAVLLADHRQAKIDELMLEYCPEDMTPEQVEEWGKHQVPAEEPKP